MLNYLKEHDIIIIPAFLFLLCMTNLPLLACGLSLIGFYLMRSKAQNIDSRFVRGIHYLLILFYGIIFILNFSVLVLSIL